MWQVRVSAGWVTHCCCCWRCCLDRRHRHRLHCCCCCCLHGAKKDSVKDHSDIRIPHPAKQAPGQSTVRDAKGYAVQSSWGCKMRYYVPDNQARAGCKHVIWATSFQWHWKPTSCNGQFLHCSIKGKRLTVVVYLSRGARADDVVCNKNGRSIACEAKHTCTKIRPGCVHFRVLRFY